MSKEIIDSHLLKVLHTLLTESSVSRTATLLGQSQPTVSVALRKLRDMTGDPLLVRSGSRMVLTAHALTLIEPTAQALNNIAAILHPTTSFNPATTSQTFRIGSPDYLDAFFVPAVVDAFHREAPGAKLEFRHLMMVDGGYEHGLESGFLDLVIGNWRTPPEHLHLQPLCKDELVCLMRNGHPVKPGRLSKPVYEEAEHLAVMTYNTTSWGTVDVELARNGLSRTVTTTLPYFGMAPYVLARSNLLFTTTRALATHYTKMLPLRIEPIPGEPQALTYYQLWHDRTHRSVAAIWLRRLIANVAKDLVS
ncbi:MULTISPECIES: LysR family transcriptional regulator [Paraburkholderia]|uniref:LysR family transcriptional regulator n=1 Tax=Paraburkholderia TaxID=1822464 RepID=UPI00224E36F6|nr:MULTISPECIES: LysR family transcriptional regulator [Paraburkholderia]MCX4173480.1 LysR family transcriptional regulator [Paraburkholderia madseniana]MDQ6461485.1 LysR family transcriptional regulator [Paraburkholderia madseniana]